ncbi:TonB-dependent receptor plug domain-containing protein [Thiohalorhabdus methylotrophus]|uniref:TonB-dependent receptor plug domain-containing protein n=1 Tax=Thiohalorhabdus methylotrophus TaxID=3242694 RepID=A0ABV4TQD5_9GAMM
MNIPPIDGSPASLRLLTPLWPVLVAVLFAPAAEAEEASSGSGPESTQLEDIDVRPQASTPLSGDDTGAGGYSFDREYLERFGGLDGSLDGVLRMVPGLQFGEEARSADSASDLRPESISISGGRYYQNQFLLDGMSISNQLDPAADNSSAINDVPGHEQSQFIDSSLLGEVRVFDANVPAAYGGFTGGVVEMETRRAGPEPEASLSYSTTRSDWVDYRVYTEDWDGGGRPPEAPDTPTYRRDRVALSYAAPVGEASGVVLGLNRAMSREPVVSLGETRTQRQLNHNAMAKLTTPVGMDGLLDVSATYAPFRSERLTKDARESAYTITGGGYGLSATLDYIGDRLDHEWELGANYSENSRSAPKDFFNWANTRSRDWGRRADVGKSREGGFGDLDKYQASVTGQWRADTGKHWVGPVGLRHRFGAKLSHRRYRFRREETLYIYQDAVVNSAVQCRGNDYDCVQEEQYFSGRNVYQADDVSVALNKGALFGEATFSYKRLTTTLGLRYSYDDFLQNHNLAYRSRATLDLFGDRGTVLRAGLNRYYGAALLTYKLREARKPYYRQYRGTEQNVVGEWQRDAGQGSYRYVFDGLNTPYSDERMLGLEQDLFGGRFRLQLVERRNRDEFARTTTPTRPDGYRYYLMSNKGSSRYRGISVGWYAELGSTLVNLHASYSKTETSNADYEDPVDDTSPSDHVYYDGKRIRYGKLDVLRKDFARPWVANLALTQPIGERLTASLSTRYRGRYTNIVSTGETRRGEQVDNGSGGTTYEQLEVYEQTTRPATFISDLKVTYEQPIVGSHTVTLQAQIKNLFNQRTHTVAEGQSGVEMGRYYWLSARYGF